METQHKWCFLQHSIEETESANDWSTSFVTTGLVDSVNKLNFAMAHIRKATLEDVSDLYFFKEGAKPMWEDVKNVNGGRLVFEIPATSNALYDHLERTLMFALLEQYPTILGVAFNKKEANNRLCLWISDSSESEETSFAWKEILKAGFSSVSFVPHRRHKEFSRNNNNNKKGRTGYKSRY